MSDQKIATEQVWATDADGVERLVAAPGDPIPEGDPPAVGYREAIDLEADTADAALAKGEAPPPDPRAEVRVAVGFEPDPDKYAPPLPKPGEKDAGKAEAAAAKAQKSGAEDKAKKKGA